MATNNSLKETLSKAPTNQVDVKQMGVKALMNTDVMKQKFHEVLKEKSQGFTASVLSLVSNDSYLAKSEPMSIVTGAMTAATLDLPLDKNLGYAYLVPFKDWKSGNIQKAQFILGYKGYIQLAQRSGKYKSINVIPVYEGELKSWNKLTEEFEFDPEGKVPGAEVIGYVGRFKLLNGFEKTTYWTKAEVEAHRIKHNKARNKTELTGVWKSDYDAMACKTVLRSLLSKWGILSIEMQTAAIRDENDMTVTETGEIKVAEPFYNDDEPIEIEELTEDKTIDVETGEIILDVESE